MASLSALNKYQSAVEAAEMVEAGMSSASSSSLSPPASTPDHLSDLAGVERKVRLSHSSPPSISASASASTSASGSEPKKVKDVDVKKQEKVMVYVDRRVSQTAMNILLAIKYYTSPLRLYLKVLVQFTTPAAREPLLASLKASDSLRRDLAAPWVGADTFGLKLLLKMRRMSRETMPLFKQNRDYMRFMKPGVEGNTPEQNRVAYYLFNEMLHPGAELEVNFHSWFDNFIKDDIEVLEQVGFDPDDARMDLVKKLAFEVNSYAAGITKLQLKFKYMSNGHVATESMDAEEALANIHTMFSKDPATVAWATKMNMWAMTDDPKTAARRVVMHGGGKVKRARNGAARKRT